MNLDFIRNGQPSGSLANLLQGTGFDVRVLRPYLGDDGRSYVTQNSRDGKPMAVLTANATATLRRDEWKIIDDSVMRAAKERLQLVADLRGNGLSLNLTNGMGKTVLETAKMGNITGAIVSMDPARKSEGDRPEYDIDNLPLPIIHKDFHFTMRQIAVAREAGTPIDTTMVEMAGRVVAEEAEKLFIGNSVFNGYSYGGGTIYGLTTHPSVAAQGLTAPTDTGWTPAVFVNEILQMRQKSVDMKRYGPWKLYLSPGWDIYLDEDYSTGKGDNTLRERIGKISRIQSITTLDYLTGFQAVLVQMSSDVIRAVVGMDITTLQWETNGGLVQNYKVMAMIVPQIRADIEGNTGIVYGNVA